MGHRLDAAPTPRPTEVQAAELRTFARQVQDQIFTTRNNSSRVPEFIYRLFRTSDEADFAAVTDTRRRRLTQ